MVIMKISEMDRSKRLRLVETDVEKKIDTLYSSRMKAHITNL